MTEVPDCCTGRRLPGTVTPLRGWGDLVFRLVVVIFFAEFIIALGYIGYLLWPEHALRTTAAAFVCGFVLGAIMRR